jgi:hypothetical protein
MLKMAADGDSGFKMAADVVPEITTRQGSTDAVVSN